MRLTHNPETQSSQKPHKAVLARDGFFYARSFGGEREHAFEYVSMATNASVFSVGGALALFGGEFTEDEAAQVVGDFAEAGGLEVCFGERAGDVESRD